MAAPAKKAEKNSKKVVAKKASTPAKKSVSKPGSFYSPCSQSSEPHQEPHPEQTHYYVQHQESCKAHLRKAGAYDKGAQEGHSSVPALSQVWSL